MKIGILTRMMPDELQDGILQHADRVQEVKLVKEKAVNLTDASERLRDPSATDIGNVDDDLNYNEDVTRKRKCYRCSGYGHMEVLCATPKVHGKGTKGSGKTARALARAARVTAKVSAPRVWQRWQGRPTHL